MTTYDDAIAALNAYGQDSLQQGRAIQKQEDQVAIDAANAAMATLTAENDDLKTQLAECQGTTEPPPPPPATRLVGMNYSQNSTIATFNKSYEKRAEIARIYVDNGRTDIRQEPEFVRAMDNGLKVVHLSWKDTSVKWLGTVPSGIKWYGTRNHEPENDSKSFSTATWKTWQNTDMPKVRAAGGIPTVNFMAWTLQAASGRHISDWSLPKGLVDVVTYDYYPTSASALKGVVDLMRSSLTLFGTTRLGIGEFGVVSGSSSGKNIIDTFLGLTEDFEFVQYWSSQVDSSSTNYRFTDATANAWYA